MRMRGTGNTSTSKEVSHYWVPKFKFGELWQANSYHEKTRPMEYWYTAEWPFNWIKRMQTLNLQCCCKVDCTFVMCYVVELCFQKKRCWRTWHHFATVAAPVEILSSICLVFSLAWAQLYNKTPPYDEQLMLNGVKFFIIIICFMSVCTTCNSRGKETLHKGN